MDHSMSSAWEILRRRKMKSPKFMGKERPVDLTTHTHTHTHTHTQNPVAMVTAAIEPKQLWGY